MKETACHGPFHSSDTVEIFKIFFQMYFQGMAKLSEDQMLHQYKFQTYFQGITKLFELINCCTINFRYIFNLQTIFPTIFQCIRRLT